ncbi:MAG TPA: sugar ABC transporter substrate-binding protein, partial [Chloroflexi bacterium]|nr:sugar ABC transporter substrate-binding protein [Chloroflexota bacterium]
AAAQPTTAPAATSGAAAAQPTTAAPAGKKVKIRLASWVGVDEGKELQSVIDKVNAQATDFEIVSEPSPQDYYTKLQTAVAGGAGPDLFWLSQEYIAGYAARGAIMDITDRLKNDQSPAAQVDDYFPDVFQTVRYQDRIYGLPWIAQPVILYYNPDLFKAAGVDEPTEDWTWDDFKTAAAKLTDPQKGVYGTAFNGWPPIHMFIWQAGGEVISEDLKSCPIDTPEAIKGEEFYADIIYNEKYAPSEATIAEQGFGEMAKAGKVAMFYGGAADDLDYAHKKDPKNAVMKAALVPKGPAGRTTFAWTAATVINAATPNPDQAYKALVALTDGIHHWKIMAPRKSLANKETIVASVPDKADSADVIVKAAQDMRSFRIIPRHQEWDDTFWKEFQDPLFHDKGTATDLAKAARPKLEALLPK